MVCKNGRPRLTDDQDRQLFAESAGTCLLCNTPLFASSPLRQRSISIAERAHVVAHSAEGPRGDPTVSAEHLRDPANIVLLCPTCHTKVDKAPVAYPPATLLATKARRAGAVALIGGAPIFGSREQARHAVELLLERNGATFRAFGPDPGDGSLGTAEQAANWSERVLDDIVPGSELIVAIVETNPDLATPGDRSAAALLRLHAKDLSDKHRRGEITAPALRFPEAAMAIFAGEE